MWGKSRAVVLRMSPSIWDGTEKPPGDTENTTHTRPPRKTTAGPKKAQKDEYTSTGALPVGQTILKARHINSRAGKPETVMVVDRSVTGSQIGNTVSQQGMHICSAGVHRSRRPRTQRGRTLIGIRLTTRYKVMAAKHRTNTMTLVTLSLMFLLQTRRFHISLLG